MTARPALLHRLRTHDGAAHGDPPRVLETAERHQYARPDGAEVRAAYQALHERGMGRG